MPDEKNTEETDNETGANKFVPPERKIKQLHKELRRLRREQSRQRKKQPRPSRSIFWGLMLILWAVLLILMQRGLMSSADLWKGFVVGLGSIFVIQAVV